MMVDIKSEKMQRALSLHRDYRNAANANEYEVAANYLSACMDLVREYADDIDVSVASAAHVLIAAIEEETNTTI